MEPSSMRRLAFIKYLFSMGIQQCAAPEPLAGAGLLSLHDSIELFLQLGAEELNITAKCGDFKDYWPHFESKLPKGRSLTQQAAMQRLNKARVALKHHGTHPSRLDLDNFKATASAFLNENCPAIFNVTFDEISLSEFVQPLDARVRLDRAKELCSSGDFDEAAGEVAIAFDAMLKHYTDRKRDQFYESPYDFGHDVTRIRYGLGGSSLSGMGAEQAIKQIIDSLGAMQKALRIIAIGLDFPKYTRFQSIVPTIYQTLDGTYHVHDWQGRTRSLEVVSFCIDFTIDSALRLLDFDASA